MKTITYISDSGFSKTIFYVDKDGLTQIANLDKLKNLYKEGYNLMNFPNNILKSIK